MPRIIGGGGLGEATKKREESLSCPKCGSDDVYFTEGGTDWHPTEHFKCDDCGTRFSIRSEQSPTLGSGGH